MQYSRGEGTSYRRYHFRNEWNRMYQRGLWRMSRSGKLPPKFPGRVINAEIPEVVEKVPQISPPFSLSIPSAFAHPFRLFSHLWDTYECHFSAYTSRDPYVGEISNLVRNLVAFSFLFTFLRRGVKASLATHATRKGVKSFEEAETRKMPSGTGIPMEKPVDRFNCTAFWRIVLKPRGIGDKFANEEDLRRKHVRAPGMAITHAFPKRSITNLFFEKKASLFKMKVQSGFLCLCMYSLFGNQFSSTLEWREWNEGKTIRERMKRIGWTNGGKKDARRQECDLYSPNKRGKWMEGLTGEKKSCLHSQPFYRCKSPRR